MERRNLLAGLLVLVLSLFMLTGTALAHKTPTKSKKTTDPGPCVVHSLPSFMDQGYGDVSSSIADIIEVECEPVYAEQTVKVSATELWSRCRGDLYWYAVSNGEWPYDGPPHGDAESSSSIGEVSLDDDGNATIAVLGGPSCAAGTSTISAHLEQAPNESTSTTFTVLAPKTTPPGSVTAFPATQIETGEYSNIATIIGVEFSPKYSEKEVRINDEQLLQQCSCDLVWVVMTPDGPEGISWWEYVDVQLDNDGNAFAVAFGGPSCASGPTEIEASLLVAPYTSYQNTFTIEPPETTI